MLNIILTPTITPTITRPFIVGFGSYGRRAERASGSCTITRPRSCADLHMVRVLAWVIVVFLGNGRIGDDRCSRPHLEAFKQGFEDCPRKVREPRERVCPFLPEKCDMFGVAARS